jgi:hypothetical protein
MATFSNVDLTAKANVYFEGNVISHVNNYLKCEYFTNLKWNYNFYNLGFYYKGGW